jgi:hypothetical protein
VRAFVADPGHILLAAILPPRSAGDSVGFARWAIGNRGGVAGHGLGSFWSGGIFAPPWNASLS